MKLTEHFKNGKFVITSEVGPVKGCIRNGAVHGFIEEARTVARHVQAVNVTDNQSAVMRLGSLAASVKLIKDGIEPIFQMTCRDRNRIALQSDLLSACSLGIENVLCLTGDHISMGDHTGAKSVFDIDSVQLLAIADTLNKGYDMVGNPLTTPTDLCLGAVVNPGFDPLDLQLMKMEKKVKAGAEFFQTQAVYDLTVFESFITKARTFGVPIQFGVVIIKSPEMAEYMNKHVSGITVSDSVIKEIAAVPKEDRKKKAVEMTVRMVNEIAHMVEGVHLMPLGWSDIVPDIISEIIMHKVGDGDGKII